MTLVQAIRIISKCLGINTGIRNNCSLSSYLKAVDKLKIDRRVVDGYYDKKYPLDEEVDDLLNDLDRREEEINLLRAVLMEKEDAYYAQMDYLRKELCTGEN